LQASIRPVFKLLLAGSLLLTWLAPKASAQSVNTYILRSRSLTQAQAACQTYGMTMVSTIRQPDTYLVTLTTAVPPAVLQQWVHGDANVNHLELDTNVAVPEAVLTDTPYVPSMPVTTYATDSHLVQLYGTSAWLGYVQQPAMYATNASTIIQPNTSGAGIVVAVIDTGIDSQNPILASALVPGYDFTRNAAGYASDLADINQSTAAILEQSTATSLASFQVVHLNQSTAAILEQSTAAILEGNPLPSHFGHGTMVAGLIHLFAPSAKIVPLKAFNADGTANVSNIVAAVYYAADNGARIINMSFELSESSGALLRAVNYATRKGVICIASAGNDGQEALVYPAAYGNVIAVGSVNQQSQMSSFSNYGSDLVTLAAPGEALITTYPGSHYAAVWGTSFSSALVAGTTADLLSAIDQNLAPLMRTGDLQRAVSHGNLCGNAGSLGAGCLNLNMAMQFFKGMNMPH
jgi:subtilisin family serine protease